MPGLRDILEAATPGPWLAIRDGGVVVVCDEHGEAEVVPWNEGAEQTTEENARLIALAPELAALVLEQNEEIQEKAKHHHRSWGHEKSFAKCMWPICESAREFAARLDQLGKEQTDGPTE